MLFLKKSTIPKIGKTMKQHLKLDECRCLNSDCPYCENCKRFVCKMIQGAHTGQVASFLQKNGQCVHFIPLDEDFED